ncbi:HYR domain-containing protein, partial [bacterium]|nr:HYR domain-containing protein [bacterium]
THTVTWTASDANGNTASCSQTVNVSDSEAPVITCAATANISTDAGLCTSSASIGTASATDNCSVSSVVPSPVGPYSVGTTTVVWTATDVNGNTATCSQVVNVTDNQTPVITCPSTANVTTDAGSCTSTASIGTSTTTDNCAGVTVSSSPAGPYSVGSHTITWTATDANGNTSSCSQTVIVTDLELSIITCPVTANINTDAGLCTSSTSIGTATATDNCSVSSIVFSPAGPYSVGSHTITWTGTDVNGNVSSCSQTVNVIDNEAPSIACPATANINTDAGLCTSSASIGTATATDNCSVASVTASPAGPYTVGSHTIIWTAIDVNGNTSTCNQIVNVTDNEAPIIGTCPANITQCDNHVVTWTNPTATDNCSATVTCSPTSGSTFATGTTIVTATATDAAGNTSSCSFTVTINESPVVALSSNVAVNADAGTCGAVVTYASAASTGAPTPTITYSQNSGTSFPVGITTVTVTATNSCGASTSSFTVTVVDNEAPSIACPATVNINTDAGLCTSSASIGTATATDNCSVLSVTASPAGPYAMGSHTIIWTATDVNGNITTCSHILNVIDNEAPVVTCPATTSINTDAGLTTSSAPIGTATASDNCSGVTVSGPVPSGPYSVGTTLVVWTATDANGNTSSCTQAVNVIDVTSLNITCPVSITLIADAGLCTSSGSIGTATTTASSVTITSSPAGPYPVGITTVIWTATDGAGNTVTCSQTLVA